MQEELNEDEKLAVNFLLHNISMSNSIQESKYVESSSFAEQLLKRRKLDDWKPMYIDTRFIIPTSNIAEQFFSKAGYLLGKSRKPINFDTLEPQMFLHINYDLWDINDVSLVKK